MMGHKDNLFEAHYLHLLREVFANGDERPSRGKLSDGTHPNTLSLFGTRTVYPLLRGLPLLTTKKIPVRSLLTELLWFLRGDTNIAFLKEHGCSVWDEWADKNGELGPVYGAQWRRWKDAQGRTHDQIAALEQSLRNDPFGRRHILSAWNVGEIGQMALPPCHVLSQFYVGQNGTLSCLLYQRSGDLFLGVPWNIACYGLLTHMLAAVLNLRALNLIHVIGDAHVYRNHVPAVAEQIVREPLSPSGLRLDRLPSLLDYRHEHIEVLDYKHHPAIKAEVAV